MESIIDYTSHWTFRYQLVTFVVIYYVFKIIWFYNRRLRRYKIFKYYGIPGPELSIWDGHASQYFANNQRFEFDKSMFLKHGNTWAGFMGDGPVLISTDRKLVRTIFIQDHDAFSERLPKVEGLIVCHGIFGCSRPRWRVFRRIMSANLSRFSRKAETSIQFMEDALQLMMNYLERKIDEAHKEKKQLDMDLSGVIKSQTLYTISEIAIKIPIQVKEDNPLVNELDNYVLKASGLPFMLTLKFPFMTKVYGWLSNLMMDKCVIAGIHKNLHERIVQFKKRLHIEEKKGNKFAHNDNLLDTLIKLENDNYITTNELLGNVESVLMAGYDTTSTTLMYTIWAIAKYQDVQKRLFDDLVIKGTDSKYLEQVLFESMRLWPSVDTFVTRLATRTVTINGVTIPEGTLVTYSAYLMHRNPDYWQEPDRFDPDRFEQGKKIDLVYYAPFGHGERRCVAYKMALLQIKLALCELVLKYQINLIGPQEMVMTSSGHAMTKPRDKINVDFVRRTPKSSLSSHLD